MDNIIVALIGAGSSLFVGILTLVGVVITTSKSSKTVSADIQGKLEVSQAVTDTKLEELTREVREHNNFAQRVPVMEREIKLIQDDVRKLRAHHER